MTTAPLRELARKRPANAPTRQDPKPFRPHTTTRGQRMVLRVAAWLFVAAAVFQMVCAATGYRL